jgi:hypothetical protein
MRPHPKSPFASFEEHTWPWLQRRVQNREKLSSADIAAVLDANPELWSNPELQSLILRALHGELDNPKGRPKLTIAQKYLVLGLDPFVREETERVRAERSGKTPGELEPSVEAARRVAKDFYKVLGSMDGRSLLNAISRIKKEFGF